MRASIIIILAFAAGMIVATPRNRNYSHFVVHPARLRVIRGFKPPLLSTAYGFGKRQSSDDLPKINKNERILFTLLRYFPQGCVYYDLIEVKIIYSVLNHINEILFSEYP